MIRLQKIELKLLSNLKSLSVLKQLVTLIIVSLICFSTCVTQAQNNKIFKVVIDAGHGGKDPGTSGYKVNEKDVALDVALKVGDLLKIQNDIEIIYTRKKDVFIGLNERAIIGNRAKADLFVSIHCNAAGSSAMGSETYVLGLHRNDDNLKVAMKENQVIKLEENYEEKYDGFDPKSPESYIGFSLMQEEYLDQSILFADYIQNNFTRNLSRKNRGVKQAGFLVLRETYMPSVLIELGFLSNRDENTFLQSAKGKSHLAKQISEAIINYKNALHVNEINEVNNDTSVNNIEEINDRYEATFHVQIAAARKKLKNSPSNFKGLDPIFRIKEGNLYKYHYAESNSHKDIQNKLLEAKEKGYKGAFIIAYLDNKKISVKEALKTRIK
jgi:N-acetylmuramoyl-L-alanine amidase